MSRPSWQGPCPTPELCARDKYHRLADCPVHSDKYYCKSPSSSAHQPFGPSEARPTSGGNLGYAEDISARPALNKDQERCEDGPSHSGKPRSGSSMRRTLIDGLRWLVGRRLPEDHELLFATYGYTSYRTPWWRKSLTQQQWRERVKESFAGFQAEMDAEEAFENALAQRRSSFTRSTNQEESRIETWITASIENSGDSLVQSDDLARGRERDDD